MNKIDIVYVGNRQSIIKEWNRRPWRFVWGRAQAVPQDFADVLIGTTEFVPAVNFAKPLEAVLDELPKEGDPPLVQLSRWGALGDLIMFRAVVAAFVEQCRPNARLVLKCAGQHREVFAGDPLWHSVISPGMASEASVFHSFDQVAEADHRGDQRSRVELFMSALTHRTLDIKPEHWQIPIPDSVMKWVDRYWPSQAGSIGIGVQLRGSGPMKTLPPAAVKMLIAKLLEMDPGVIVYLLDHDGRFAEQFRQVPEGSDPARVVMRTGRDAVHGVAAMRGMQLVITMDSGVLWMAHWANCPVVCIMGPTRPSERLTFHPRYPSGARATRLNELIDCPSCFEAATKCDHEYTCMQKQPDWPRAIGAIIEDARAVLEGECKYSLSMYSESDQNGAVMKTHKKKGKTR